MISMAGDYPECSDKKFDVLMKNGEEMSGTLLGFGEAESGVESGRDKSKRGRRAAWDTELVGMREGSYMEH